MVWWLLAVVLIVGIGVVGIFLASGTSDKEDEVQKLVDTIEIIE